MMNARDPQDNMSPRPVYQPESSMSNWLRPWEKSLLASAFELHSEDGKIWSWPTYLPNEMRVP